MAKRPLVVLAGWLGCKPKSLERYANMYRSLGWDVTIIIPSPQMVVSAAVSSEFQNHYLVQEQKLNTKKAIELTNKSPVSNMLDLAIQTIEEIKQSNCSTFVFHVFSNGGCFLWEAVRNILWEEKDFTHNIDTKIKLLGIIFDSAPANYSTGNGSLIFDSLEYCSPSEREQIKHIEIDSHRALNYWDSMKNGFLNAPELYILSRDDNLTPFKPLKDLISYRQMKHGKNKVQSLTLNKSPHCCHIMTSPILYEKRIKDFILDCCAEHSFAASREENDFDRINESNSTSLNSLHSRL
mmetsp:Transcript_7364/g.9370  ORF Transcript_7364/g.9370 Transcript_7364/m.9370 type:complete len:295 (+) Transcript_7364:165-1049(+)